MYTQIGMIDKAHRHAFLFENVYFSAERALKKAK